AVGEGDCSFPAREVEIYEGYNRQYEEGTWALTTRQTMRRLAYCASQGDPFAILYLGHAYKHTTTVAELECPYAKRLYRIAYPKIAEIAENPSDPQYEHANFQLALEAFNNWRSIPYLSSHLTPLEYLERIPTSRRGELLKRLYQLRYGPKNEKPRWEEFLDGDDLKNHPWAFLRSMNFFRFEGDEYIKAYESALSKCQHPGFLLELADVYKEEFESPWTDSSLKHLYKEKALPLLKRAGELGCPIAYLKMTEFFIPNEFGFECDFDFEKVQTKEDLLLCCEYITKAAYLGLPEAFFHLGQLTSEYYTRIEELAPLPREINLQAHRTMDFFHKIAVQQGLWWAYEWVAEDFPNDVAFHQNYPSLREEKKRLYNLVVRKAG
ncbi:MAG TPA: hypothetical protein VNJ29_01785, partial [Candidatus Nitrosotenuis sp.]|nr:hypothetical protein [Candidatus Nitrosotenuis sp.]